MPAIEAHDLKRTYRTSTGIFRRRMVEVEAVRGVSFEVPEGELFGLLGPNGGSHFSKLSRDAGSPVSGASVLTTVPRAVRPLGRHLVVNVYLRPTRLYVDGQALRRRKRWVVGHCLAQSVHD
jgi:ABC-type microcin C transport system duplicated ATPase subunit YejF